MQAKKGLSAQSLPFNRSNCSWTISWFLRFSVIFHDMIIFHGFLIVVMFFNQLASLLIIEKWVQKVIKMKSLRWCFIIKRRQNDLVLRSKKVIHALFFMMIKNSKVHRSANEGWKATEAHEPKKGLSTLTIPLSAQILFSLVPYSCLFWSWIMVWSSRVCVCVCWYYIPTSLIILCSVLKYHQNKSQVHLSFHVIRFIKYMFLTSWRRIWHQTLIWGY